MNVGDFSFKGADSIQPGDDGRIIDFEVMIRPTTALLALGEEMKKQPAA